MACVAVRQTGTAGTSTGVSRGFTLVETAVAAAVACVATIALFFAFAQAARFAGHAEGTARQAARIAAENVFRDAAQSWKYGSPGTLAASASNVTVTAANATSTGAHLTVRVQYTPDPGHAAEDGTVTIEGDVFVKAPLPGSQVAKPGLIPRPTGAP